MSDLVALTAALVDIPSVSHQEQALAGFMHRELSQIGQFDVERLGDNVVARTQFGRDRRLLLAGHLDTVPPQGDSGARIEGDVVWGVGAADMKGGLAVMLDVARAVEDPKVDLTFVFYAREEVAARHNGLLELFGRHPELLQADLALLGEPTGGALEAGCQGTMRLRVRLKGERAHTARPWLGLNAIHRLGKVLSLLDRYEPRTPQVEGCTFRESLQAVLVEGGVAGNVVPDRAEVVVNHRFAPDRSPEEAERSVRDLLAPVLEHGDEVEVIDMAPAAPPGLSQPMLAELVAGTGLEVRAKLGWTDVARFAEHGIPAANLGPGNPELAHTAGERVDRAALEAVRGVLAELAGV